MFYAKIRFFVTLIIVFSRLFQSLRDKQKSVRESQGPNMKQMKMWSVSIVFLLKTCQRRGESFDSRYEAFVECSK